VVETTMVVKAAEATSLAVGGLRPMDPTRDLKAIADLVAEAFADEIDERGRAVPPPPLSGIFRKNYEEVT